MSKRKNEDNSESPPPAAAKKMNSNQNEDIISHGISSPEEIMFHYEQGRIDVSWLYLAPKFADVYFVFDSDGTATRIPAHKNLLAMASNVFEEMFFGEMKEIGDITITDAPEATFREFLQFFYLNEVKLSANHVASVLSLGNKYNVENCADACVKFLIDELTNENVCTTLSLAILYEQNELTKACEKQILLNTADIFKAAGFLECSKDVLAYILKMDIFSCSEADVFEACMEWVRAKSKQQILSKALVEKHLGDLYYRIHFVSMTTKEFCFLDTKYSAELSSDFRAIIRLIKREDIHSEHFNTSPRQVEWNDDENVIIECDRDDDDSEVKSCSLAIEEKTTFSISEPLLLGRILCGGIFFDEYDPEYLINVEATITEACTLDDNDDDENKKKLSSMTANLGSDPMYIISLPNPILIRPNLFYTICIKKFPKGHRFASRELFSSMSLDSNIKIEFHNDKVHEGKVVGLIWKLNFNKI